jgi:hypothetical protein
MVAFVVLSWGLQPTSPCPTYRDCSEYMCWNPHSTICLQLHQSIQRRFGSTIYLAISLTELVPNLNTSTESLLDSHGADTKWIKHSWVTDLVSLTFLSAASVHLGSSLIPK